MLVLGEDYLDLSQVVRDFYSTRQDYSHSQQEVLVKEISTSTPRKYIEYKASQGELLGEPLTETTLQPGT